MRARNPTVSGPFSVEEEKVIVMTSWLMVVWDGARGGYEVR